MRSPDFHLATLDEAAPFLARLRKALAGDVAKPEPVPEPDAPAPPPHWQQQVEEREPGED